jgi:hypothetical protein
MRAVPAGALSRVSCQSVRLPREQHPRFAMSSLETLMDVHFIISMFGSALVPHGTV